jgi:hypothetical protein
VSGPDATKYEFYLDAIVEILMHLCRAFESVILDHTDTGKGYFKRPAVSSLKRKLRNRNLATYAKMMSIPCIIASLNVMETK